MDQLETQVSDLRYLTQNAVLGDDGSSTTTPGILSPQNIRGSPLSLSVIPGDGSGAVRTPTPTRPPNRSYSTYSSASLGGGGGGDLGDGSGGPGGLSLAAMGGGGGGASGGGGGGMLVPQTPSVAGDDDFGRPSAGKRKSEDESSKQVRSKRNRYISIACNECKRRKIKCNGETPCQRCGNLSLQCLYSPNCCSTNFRDSDEYKAMSSQMMMLQEQVENLYQTMGSLQQQQQQGGSSGSAAGAAQQAVVLPATSSVSATVTSSPSSSIPSSHKAGAGLGGGSGSVESALPLQPPGPPTSFRGPTSTTFSLDVAKNTLHTMGYSSISGSNADLESTTVADDLAMMAHESPPVRGGGPNVGSLRYQHRPSRQDSGISQRAGSSQQQQQMDPLWDFDKDEMVRLCRVHEEEIGIMYPVLNIETVIAHAKNLAAVMESAKLNGVMPTNLNNLVVAGGGFSPDEDGSGHSGGGVGMGTDEKTLQLKTVMCCALVVEEHGHSEKATRLFESVRPVADRRLMSDPADVSTLPFLALVAGYRFLSNDEILAWRVMGQVTRLCIELGLHRRDAIMKIPDASHQKNAINTFWSAYVLDRRWSFGTGLPYVLQDNEIDPNLPMPDAFPYLVAMITYSRVGAKVWRLVSHFEPAVARDLRREDIEALDREILNWYQSNPQEVQIKNWEKEKPLTSTPSYNLQRLQIWTYLRLNQIRIWLFTPILHSASSIMGNLPLAQKAVDLAKDTIQYLSWLNNTTNLYRRVQVFYHQFLTSAIAVLFLASCHAPVQFSSACRGEFYAALDLVKDLSSKSWVSQRLWRTIRSLKDFAPRLGLQEDDPHSVAALAMAGMATGNSSYPRGGAAPPGQTPTPPAGGGYGVMHAPALPMQPQQQTMEPPGPHHPQQQQHHPENGLLIQSEMSRMFEGYVTLNSFSMAVVTNGTDTPPTPAITSAGHTAQMALESIRNMQAPHGGGQGMMSSATMQSGLTTPADENGAMGMGSAGVRAAMQGGGTVFQHFKDMF